MSKDIIIIPTYNGVEHVWGLMRDMPKDTDIIIVDTGGSEAAHMGLEEILKEYTYAGYNVILDRTPYKGRPYGALLWVYWMYPEYDGFMLLHDSLEITDKNFLQRFKTKMPDKGIVAWALHPFFFDTENQEICMKYMYGKKTPPYLVFGPIFYTNRKSLDKLYNEDLLPAYPVHKHQDQGIERAIAMVFHQSGMKIESVCGVHNIIAIPGTTFAPKVFKKTFAHRK